MKYARTAIAISSILLLIVGYLFGHYFSIYKKSIAELSATIEKLVYFQVNKDASIYLAQFVVASDGSIDPAWRDQIEKFNDSWIEVDANTCRSTVCSFEAKSKIQYAISISIKETVKLLNGNQFRFSWVRDDASKLLDKYECLEGGGASVIENNRAIIRSISCDPLSMRNIWNNNFNTDNSKFLRYYAPILSSLRTDAISGRSSYSDFFPAGSKIKTFFGRNDYGNWRVISGVGGQAFVIRLPEEFAGDTPSIHPLSVNSFIASHPLVEKSYDRIWLWDIGYKESVENSILGEYRKDRCKNTDCLLIISERFCKQSEAQKLCMMPIFFDRCSRDFSKDCESSISN